VEKILPEETINFAKSLLTNEQFEKLKVAKNLDFSFLFQ